MKMNKKLAPILLVVMALGIIGVLSFRWWKNNSDHKILVSGNIELTEVDISFKMPGRLVELAVNEGDPVRKGMVLAGLDQEQLLHQREREQAALTVAETQLNQLRTAIEQQREIVQGQIAQRQAELNQAEANLRRLLAGSRPQEIEQAQAAVREARAQYELARRDWERAQVLYQNEDISTSQYEQFRARFDAAAAALRQAEERAALVVEGPRREDIEAARAQVAWARAGLQLAEASRLELRRREQELGTRRAGIERAQAQVAIVRSQLEDSVAVSPIDGVVLVKAADEGEVIAAGTTVLTLGDLDHPWLRAYIPEEDLGKVKLGARGKVTTDSFPGKVYGGRVSFISSEAEFTPKQIQTPEERVKLVYRIKIDVENPQHELKANMPADAEILLDEGAPGNRR
ncbi:MAG: efflux RND transporter periplasmic adaptor subunit [Acidobacteria bacterium]|nr:efflux RND transporter periplasmic adaptor subunit [Acidobacteriota bacterium]